MHIITPYNPWAPKKKKTWQERLWEEQAIAEVEARMIAEASSRTLPDNAPETSMATAGPAVNAPAGGGGSPPPQYYTPQTSVPAINRTPSTAVAPARIQFTNLTPNPHLYRFNWVFSDGQTSAEFAPLMTFQTGSGAAYGITASLQTSNSLGNAGAASVPVYTLCTPPVVTALFTLVSSSNTAPSTCSFTNASTNTSQIPTTTYLWTYGSGSTTSVLVTPPDFIYTVAGAYTASLEATGSYGISSSYTSSFILG